MLTTDTKLYFSSVIFNLYQNKFWQDLYNELPANSGGRFHINLARKINPNRTISRDSSIWSIPLPQDIWPGFETPTYDPTFSLTFGEVSDLVACSLRDRINQNNEKFAIMWSGGIDSTVVLVALLKNLTQEELKNVAVCTSISAIIEYPNFYNDHIVGKFKLLDSFTLKYDDLIRQGYSPITADEGDCIFGTFFGLQLYYNWKMYANMLSADSRHHISTIIDKVTDPTVHWTQFKDLLIEYFQLVPNQDFPYPAMPEVDKNFGRLLYEKFELNIKTTQVPINSLHDFFWWLIFNVKYLNCAVRGGLYFNDTLPPKDSVESIVNWYSFPQYQLWSMANNNNGTKIKLNAASYKWAAREYIYDFDKNPYYKHFKLKLESMGIPMSNQNVNSLPKELRPNAKFAVDTNYNWLYIDDNNVQNYIKQHFHNFKIDWA